MLINVHFPSPLAPSTLSTIISPVIILETASMMEEAVRTLLRAEETPVRRETTTKMFRGTL
jgi:hypothetical protein